MSVSARKLRRRLTLFLLFCGYVLLMTSCGVADRLILHPSNQPVKIPGVTRGPDVTAPSGNVEIWTARSAGAESSDPQAFVLSFIGNASRAEYESALVAEEWNAHSVEVWSVNYPGYGQSTGPAKLKAIPAAALAAYDRLASHAAGRRIFLSGNSLGTAASLYVAANRPVAGLVLHNPPPLRRLILGHYGWWNLWLAACPIAMDVPSQLESMANARQVRAPAVFVLAGRDQIVPPRYHQMVVDAYAGPAKLVEFRDAGHNDWPEGADAAQVATATNWLWDLSVRK